MTIQWKEIPQKRSDTSLASDSASADLWFGISLALLGLIVGFVCTWIIALTA